MHQCASGCAWQQSLKVLAGSRVCDGKTSPTTRTCNGGARERYRAELWTGIGIYLGRAKTGQAALRGIRRMEGQMNWEVALYIAFSTVGIIQYLKGIAKAEKTIIWATMQPILCILLAFLYLKCPEWVSIGVLAFALSQLGYETIIQAIKKKLEDKT